MGDSQNFLNDLPWGSGREAPKLETHEGKMEAYVVSMYLVTMTLTTVGYGDISAESTPERIGYILLFIGGAFVWGNLLVSLLHITSRPVCIGMSLSQRQAQNPNQTDPKSFVCLHRTGLH